MFVVSTRSGTTNGAWHIVDAYIHCGKIWARLDADLGVFIAPVNIVKHRCPALPKPENGVAGTREPRAA